MYLIGTKTLPALMIGIGIALCVIAASVFMRPKAAETVNASQVQLLTQATGDACLDSATPSYADKFQSDSAKEEIHFVGCGGFF